MTTRPAVLDRHRPALEAALKRSIGPSKSPLYAMLRYQLGWNDHHGMPVLHTAGDRTHAALLLLLAESLGGDTARAVPPASRDEATSVHGSNNGASSIPAAAGMELAHACAQVHLSLRHGDPGMPERPALWWVFSSSQGINAGDGLYSLARLSLMESATLGAPPAAVTHALAILDRACIALAQAHDRQITLETAPAVSPDDYADALEQCGAALPSAAATIGALLGGATDDAVEHAGAFGRHTGAAWRLRQELDTVENPVALAKSFVEALDNRRSLPLLHALSHATGADAQHLAALRRRDIPITDDALAAILPILDRTGSPAWIAQRISRALRLADASLASLPLPSSARDNLAAFARHLAGQES
ncbi:MAG: hypothetical protein EXR49_09120 [Dehalococcoidia bacterium]|nr:hypothetical protein [Dehalococcoidia bacterium]